MIISYHLDSSVYFALRLERNTLRPLTNKPRGAVSSALERHEVLIILLLDLVASTLYLLQF